MFEFINQQAVALQQQAETLVQNNEMDPKYLQMALNALVDAGLVVDGVLGAKTTAAVILFQKSMGLSPDGIVGKNTKLALINSMAELQRKAEAEAAAEAEAQQAVTQQQSIVDFIPELQKELEQHVVEVARTMDIDPKYLQNALNVLSGGKITLTVDGVIGAETIAAIKLFQEANNLTADGFVGPDTKEVLLRKMADKQLADEQAARERQAAFEEQERLKELEIQKQIEQQKLLEEQERQRQAEIERQKELEKQQTITDIIPEQKQYEVVIPEFTGNTLERLTVCANLYKIEMQAAVNQKVSDENLLKIQKMFLAKINEIIKSHFEKTYPDFIGMEDIIIQDFSKAASVLTDIDKIIWDFPEIAKDTITQELKTADDLNAKIADRYNQVFFILSRITSDLESYKTTGNLVYKDYIQEYKESGYKGPLAYKGKGGYARESGLTWSGKLGILATAVLSIAGYFVIKSVAESEFDKFKPGQVESFGASMFQVVDYLNKLVAELNQLTVQSSSTIDRIHKELGQKKPEVKTMDIDIFLKK